MSDPHESASPPAALLRVATLGGAGAAGLSALVQLNDGLVALQLLAGGALLAAAALAILRPAVAEPPAIDLRLLIASCAAGAVLWLLAPWSSRPDEQQTEPARAPNAVEQTWLCSSSLLAAPYVLPRGRVLLIHPERGSLLQTCAQARARGEVELAPAARNPRNALAARAWAARRGRYDVVQLSLHPPPRPLPLGVLPFASTPLETVEGVRDLLAALAPRGVLAATALGEPLALRFLHTARAALRLAGVTDSQRHFVVYGAAGAYTLLVQASPFDTDSLLALHDARIAPVPAAPESLRSWPAWLRTPAQLQATPGAAFDTRMAAELRATDDAQQTAGYAFDIAAARDDRPLFYELTRRDRFDTWSEGTSYWVLARACTVAVLLALLVAWLATRARASASTPRSRRALLIVRYWGLALGHVLAFAWAQQQLTLWLLRPAVAPALCALVMGGTAGVALAIRSTSPSMRRGLRFALASLAPALLTGLALATRETPPFEARHGFEWAALAALAGLGLALGGTAGWLPRRATPLRAAAVASYVAGAVPAVLAAPGLVLLWGHHAVALGAASGLAVAALASLVPPPVDLD